MYQTQVAIYNSLSLFVVRVASEQIASFTLLHKKTQLPTFRMRIQNYIGRKSSNFQLSITDTITDTYEWLQVTPRQLGVVL